ncbi:hypothetical protein DFH08DRAFT_972542 [Mycena albidolilacea]|uniref:Uncharacterized protein n=1 Tax=Mycena albidolilacea TaxID=1033008 RepID=A0AAD7EDY0_9AGAR|nr:hypothetical protein DFH08DRAFT_972542 [Mycena albidolilacea]
MHRPSVQSDTNICPYCWTHLPIRLCQKGDNAGRRFLMCKSHRCKEHCIILNNGSCPVKKHHPSFMSQRQRRKANVPAPACPSKSVPPLSAAELSILDGISGSNSFQWDYGPALQRTHIDQPALYLDQALRRHLSPTLTPPQLSWDPLPASPEQDVDAREARELRLAMELSLASTAEPSSIAGLSQPSPTARPSQPSASTSTLTSTSTPTSQRRAQAASVATRTTLPKPRITTQLNPTWMSQASGTRPANDTFNTRQPAVCRAAVDPSTVRRFTLIYWDAIFGVTECPSWPEFQLSESTDTLELLSTHLSAVEYYDVRFRLWTRVNIDYTHILTENTYLLLRRVGVSGLDESKMIDHLVNLPGPQHIRYNLPAEREAVREKIKARHHKSRHVSDDEGSELEVSEVFIKSEPGLQTERPSLRIRTGSTPDYICLDVDSAPSSLPSASFRSSCSSRSTTPSTTPTTPIESSLPIPIPCKWPSGAYTVDMANGFLTIEAPEVGHLPIATRFQRVFKTDSPYKARTYSDARLHWSWGPQELHASALEAGKTEAGFTAFQMSVDQGLVYPVGRHRPTLR